MKKRILLFVLVLAAVTVGAAILKKRSESVSFSRTSPVSAVITDRSVCSVTLTLTGNETPAALDLFRSVCEGLNVKPCIFVSTDWLKSNPALSEKLDFAELGLLLPERFSGRTKKKTMELLAAENDRFLDLTDRFPKFVRLSSGEPSANLSNALQSFGQCCIGSSISLTDSPQRGAICDCGKLNGTTGYALAKFCAEVIGAKAACVPLSELLTMQI